MLRDWRQPCAATAIVTAALLPFAVVWHVSYLAALRGALITAVTLAAGCHFVRESRLTTLAIFPEFASLPELAGRRRRLVSPRTRRRSANWLRATAAITHPAHPFDGCPVLPDRVAAVRCELLGLADAVEHSRDPDPVSVAFIHELLADGCSSPLYNRTVAADELHAALCRAHAGLAEPPPA